VSDRSPRCDDDSLLLLLLLLVHFSPMFAHHVYLPSPRQRQTNSASAAVEIPVGSFPCDGVTIQWFHCVSITSRRPSYSATGKNESDFVVASEKKKKPSTARHRWRRLYEYHTRLAKHLNLYLKRSRAGVSFRIHSRTISTDDT
jgi:hypothetical protein